MDQQFFTKQLLKWAKNINRPMPWKGEKNPYYIWLSEIILQQTRIAQGTPYYKAFVKTFPTVNELAVADEEVVLKLWQGLGYYSRARNLKKTARKIISNFGGILPSNIDDLKTLPGIGAYTSKAIMAIAFNKPIVPLDFQSVQNLSASFLLPH